MPGTVHVDKALARRILAGDQQAFRTFFDRMFPRLYRFALVRLDGDAQSATDVVQQTFCHALEHLDRYRGEAALYTWMCRICRNALTDHWRRRLREAPAVPLVEDSAELVAVLEVLAAAADDQPERVAEQRELARAVQAVLDHLPGRYGDVLEWKYVEGLSVAEIAARMKTTPKAVESLLTRSRQAFREAVDALGSAVLAQWQQSAQGGESP